MCVLLCALRLHTGRPARERGGDEQIRISSHLGTHVDAPLHYGSTCEGRHGRTIPEIGPETAVLLRTGQEQYDPGDFGFHRNPGMTRAGTPFLAEKGVEVMGTDAVGWDRPFLEMRRAFAESGEASETGMATSPGAGAP